MRRGRVLAVCALVVLLAQLVLVLAGKDYYATLGLKRDATERQIKKAYRTLSKELHPDKNREDPQAQEKFMAVANAYEVLTDKEKRRIYDQHGEEGLKQQGGGAQRDPFDLFSQFGFGGFGQQQQRQEDQRGDDVTLDLHASLEDLYNGRATEVSVKKQVLCPKCRGSGAKSEDDVKTCPVCKGKGVTITMQQLGPGFVQQIQNQCSRCGGKGKIVSSVCPHCSGKKVVGGEQVLDVFVEQGMADAQTISFENAGDERPDKAAGHINFKIKTLPHKHFRRSGNDLHYTIHISLLESLVGFTKHVTHLDGHKVKLERDRVTEHGHVMVVRGEGMPHYGYASKKGDLHVKYIVDFPKKLTDQQRKGFGEILK